MNFYDLHCHILYGVDDASKNLTQSMDMLHMASIDGIKVIAATSHLKKGVYDNDIERFDKAIKELQAEIDKKGLDISLIRAAENYVSYNTMHLLKEKRFIPYGNTQYILVEFAWKINVFDDPTRFLKAFIKTGYIPVIAHPERYEWVHKDYSLLFCWRKMGCLFQVNRTSILGLDKHALANTIVKRMLDDDLVDIVASDAHHAYAPRLPKLSDAYHYVEKHYGKQRADRYFIDMPLQIIGEKKAHFE